MTIIAFKRGINGLDYLFIFIQIKEKLDSRGAWMIRCYVKYSAKYKLISCPCQVAV